ncbi:hypothetical protein ACXR8F_02095 [Terrabacter sp. AAH1]
MTTHSVIEDELRERLDRATSAVPAEPDLGASIAGGRRRRAVRRGGALVAGVTGAAVVAGLTVVGAGTLQRSVPPAAQPAAGAAASSTDWVAGSTVDETLVQVVDDAVARPGTATDVYPSDWTRSTPLPDAQASRATEWQAVYRVDDDETLTVLMSQRPVDAPQGPRVCDASSRVVDARGSRVKVGDIAPNGEVSVLAGRSAQGAAACVARQVSGGTLVVTHDGPRTTATLWRTVDSTVVTATSVLDGSADPASRRVTDGELEAVATDPRLTFAHVADPPAWPASNGPGWPAGL